MTEATEATVEQAAQPQLDEKTEAVMSWIEGITVLELSNLVKALEDRLGVSAAAPMAMMAAPAAGGDGAAAVEEQTEFTVVLAAVGPQKIGVIKEGRAITGLGLKDSTDLVDGAPTPVKEGVTKAEAEELKKKLEAAGATVEIK